jgi:integrase
MGLFKRGKVYWMCYNFNGKQKQKSSGVTDRKMAQGFLDKIKTEIVEGKYLDKKRDQKIKFEDFADEYLVLHTEAENKSWKKTNKVLVKTLKEFFTGYCLSEITKELVLKFRAKRLKEVTGATVNRNLACLKSIFNRAIDWGRFDGHNPVAKMKKCEEPEGRTRYLQETEVVRLVECCEDRFKPYVIVAINTGLRQNEMLSLEWGDLDFSEDMIYALKTKNKKMREIPMNKAVRTALLSIKKQPDSPYVFCNKEKRSNVNIRCAFARALKKAGIKEFRWHDLRHTTGSLLCMSGIDINTVREILGHTTTKMTQRYAHLSRPHLKKAVAVLDGISEGINSHDKPLDEGESMTKVLHSPNSNLEKDFKSITNVVE